VSAPDRHARQVRFAPISTRGQRRIESARALLVGCGALGGHIAQSLVRAGIGELRLVDRDTVEETNLPRQVLFTEVQARLALPKALASVESLAPIGARTVLVPRVAHLDARLLDELGEGVDLVLDGTDNLETRYLLNDWCVARGVPWVYGGVVGASGLVLPVRPGAGACLACAFPTPPPAGTLPTCETAGVIQPAVALVAALQAACALRLLVDPEGTPSKLVEVDAWNLRVRELELPRDPDCRACTRREFPHLADAAGPRAMMFGFLNVFLAAAFLHAGVDAAQVAPLLDERDVTAIIVGPDALRWRDLALSTRELAAFRRTCGASFGSCSFDEPVHDLAALHLT